MSAEVLLSWPRPGIALVTLNRPDQLNAITPSLLDSFVETLQRAASDPRCRVVVLTGAGRGFCAGLDLAAGPEDAATQSIADRYEGQERFASLPRTIRNLRQPVIAAVNGAAAGAGMAITLASDIRVAASSASFHIAAVKIGLSAGECGISYYLPRLIGASKAYEYMLTARPIRSDDADRLGLVARVVPDGEVVDAALDLAGEIAAHSPFAIWQTKQVMRQNVDHDFETAIAVENRAQILAVGTEDSAEAIRAFLARRPPVFTGR
jgi:enoyl-CoA hydratase